MSSRVVYLQRRSHKAGAQTCLARLVRNPHIKVFNPIVICAEYGWLTDELARHQIEFLVTPFPSSRALSGRLFLNRLFSSRLAAVLRGMGDRFLIHGNDHQEAPLTLLLARKMKAISMIFLRSPSMTQREYERYKCDQIDVSLTVSEDLLDRLRSWDPSRFFHVVSDGIYPEEIANLPLKQKVCPKRFIVLGSPLKWKGWRDVVDALVRLRSEGVRLDGLMFDFTGNEPGIENDLDLDRIPEVAFSFLGRRQDFPALLSAYDFAINPSRHETFGMAAVETVAFGLSLLSSRTGVLGDLLDSRMMFSPGNVDELANKLRVAISSPTEPTDLLRALQRRLISRYNLGHSSETLAKLYETKFA
jgi:glycosyltransferase involved in cell wall biosynthesis